MRRPLLLLGCAALLSCTTVPPEREAPGAATRWLALLPADSTVFVAIDVAGARTLLEEAAQRALAAASPRPAATQEPSPQPSAQQPSPPSVRQIRAVLDRTQKLYAGLSPVEGGRPSFSGVALGRFGPAAVRCRLAGSAKWARAELPDASSPRRERLYFVNRESGLQVAAPQAGLVLLSTASVERQLEQRRGGGAQSPAAQPRLPEDALADLERAAVFAYWPAPPPALGRREAGSPVAIRDLWVTAQRDPDADSAFLAGAVFRLQAENSPRALEAAFRLLLAAWLRGSGLDDPVGRLKRAQVLAEGTVVRVRGLPFSGAELADLAGRAAFAAGGGAAPSAQP